MAFSIYIYENDDTIFSSLKIRLGHYFSEAYIINPFSCKDKITKDVSDFSIVLFDNRQYKMPDNKTTSKCEYIPLFSHDENNQFNIDCSRIVLLIKNILNTTNIATGNSQGYTNLLLPFVYIDEREHFIKKMFIEAPSTSQYVIRIDLMSGIRMPSSFKTGANTGSLTELINEAGRSDFTPNQILDYLNPDSLGFLSPGKPIHPDDVFDADKSHINSLISHFKRLIDSKEVNADGIIVCEGWKTADVLTFTNRFDNIHILLPSRQCDEVNGMDDYIGALKRSLSSGSQLHIHYFEDYKNNNAKELINAAII